MGKTFEGAQRNLDSVLKRLSGASLKLKVRKCDLFKKEVLFLGCIITDEGIKTYGEKIKAVTQWPRMLQKSVCISQFVIIARPLHRLTERGANLNERQNMKKHSLNLS